MRRSALGCVLALALSGFILGANQPAAEAGERVNMVSPVPLHAPWTAGVTFRLTDSFGHGGHTDANNDFYATDWKRKGAGCNADIGEPILAPQPGKVIFVQKRDLGIGSGGKVVFVQLDAAPSVTVHFYHLDTVSVTKGDRVKAADQIGTLGRTGLQNSNCAHLHFGVRQTVQRVAVSIKPGLLDGQAINRNATITSQNVG